MEARIELKVLGTRIKPGSALLLLQAQEERRAVLRSLTGL